MIDNPRLKARYEAQKAMYAEEDRKLRELAQKRAEEKERREFAEGLGIQSGKPNAGLAKSPAEQLENGAFFSSLPIVKEKDKNDDWYREFETSFREETGLQTPKDKAVQKRNETIKNTYNTGEEWLMSDNGDDLAKGFINRFRSSAGEGVEDLAYLINDVAPWYKPAKEVVDKNVAGNIAATADRQFEKAKEKTGDFGDRLIDGADSGAEMLGLSILGPKAFTYVFGSKEGFEEYRVQRENGVPQELAFKRALAKAGYSIIGEKLDDFIGKNIPIDDVLFLNTTDNNSEAKRYFEDFFEDQKEITASQHNEVLQFRNSRNKIDIQNGVSYFPKNEEISEYVKKVKPQKYEGTNSYYFDVGMHGNQINVAFSSAENAATASPEALAITIAQNKNYVKRQPVRLLSCNTGVQLDGKECFAQKLANVLNAPVLAPNNYLYIDVNGSTSVGLLNEGKMILFQPHYGLNGSENIANLDKETWRALLRRIIK